MKAPLLQHLPSEKLSAFIAASVDAFVFKMYSALIILKDKGGSEKIPLLPLNAGISSFYSGDFSAGQ